MLAYYRYKVQKGLMELSAVPEPYQSLLREEMEPQQEPESPVDGEGADAENPQP